MSISDIIYKHIRQAIKESATIIAEYARENHRFKAHTGQMERSVVPESISNTSAVIRLDTAVAPYAAYVHQGTAAHRIVPRRRMALRWTDGGRFRFSKWVNHPGTRSDPFLYQAADTNRDKVAGIVDRQIETAKDDIAAALTGR
ncbi:MAG: hypothetical protein SPI25_05225 [Dialister sp.]|nr:hypothetical protein [Dialister sp.]